MQRADTDQLRPVVDRMPSLERARQGLGSAVQEAAHRVGLQRQARERQESRDREGSPLRGGPRRRAPRAAAGSGRSRPAARRPPCGAGRAGGRRSRAAPRDRARSSARRSPTRSAGRSRRRASASPGSMASRSMLSTRTWRGVSSSGFPARAARYAVMPSRFRAEKAGGTCSSAPTNVASAVATCPSPGSGPASVVIGPSASSVTERCPSRMVAV